MPSLLESLSTLLTDRDAVTTLAARIGGTAEDADAAIGPALARIIDGLAVLAADRDGGLATVKHLVDHHGEPTAEHVDEHLDRARTVSGNVILDRVFGAERGLVVIGLASALGLAPSLVGRLLPVLAPLVTAELHRRRDLRGLDDVEVAALLAEDRRAIAQAGLLDGTTFDVRQLDIGGTRRVAPARRRERRTSEVPRIDLELPGPASTTATLAMLETAETSTEPPTMAATTDVEPPLTTDEGDDETIVGSDGPATGVTAEVEPGTGSGPPLDSDAGITIEADVEVEVEVEVDADADADADAEVEVEVVPGSDDGDDLDRTDDLGEAAVPPDATTAAALAWLGWAAGAVVLVLLLAWLLSTCGAATDGETATETVIDVGGTDEPTTDPATDLITRATTPAGPVTSPSESSREVEAGDAGSASSASELTTESASPRSGSVTEAELQGAVSAILRDSGVDGVVSGDRVTLTGIVSDEETRDWLEDNVSVLLGVAAIDNQIAIASPELEPESTSDAEPTAPAAPEGSEGPGGEVADAPAVPVGATLNELLTLGAVTFASGSPDLTAEGRAVLDVVGAYLLDRTDLRIEIGGHTDSDGAEDANLELSQERADIVRRHLIEAGVGPERLTAVGFGEAEPVVANDSLDNKAVNRRIDFTVR